MGDKVQTIPVQKAITSGAGGTASIQDGGYLQPKQQNAFLRQIFEATRLLREVRRKPMNSPEEEIDGLTVARRVMRGVDKANENENQISYLRHPSFYKISLKTNKYSLSYAFSEDSLEDNIEGRGFAATLAYHFAQQAANDVEDLGLNGADLSPTATTLTAGMTAGDLTAVTADNTTFPANSDAGYLKITTGAAFELVGYTGKTGTTDFTGLIRGDGPPEEETTAIVHNIGDAVEWYPHPLIGVDDGWIKLSEDGGGTVIDGSTAQLNNGDLHKKHFFEMYRAMPDQYRDNSNLVWIISPDQFINWQEYLGTDNANRGYDILAGNEHYPLGIRPINCTKQQDRKIELTWPKNFILGIQRQLKVKTVDSDTNAVFQDLIYVNMKMRCDAEVERKDGVVIMDALTGTV